MNLKELGISVYDAHTHSGGTDTYNSFIGNIPHTQAAEDLALKARIGGVDKVVTFPFPGSSYYNAKLLVEEGMRVPSGFQNFPYEMENGRLVQDCNYLEGRLLPFGCVDPTTRVSEQIDSLSELVDRKKIFGLKFHSLACGCDPQALAETGFLDFAEERNLPFMIHSGVDENSHPKHVLKIAKAYKSVRFCIAHLAALDEGILSDIPKYENVFVDCSPFLQICRDVYHQEKTVYYPNLIQPKNPVVSLSAYFKRLEDDLIWGTDEPWTHNVNSDGIIRTSNSYFDEIHVIEQLADIDVNLVIKITNINTRSFLFG